MGTVWQVTLPSSPKLQINKISGIKWVDDVIKMCGHVYAVVIAKWQQCHSKFLPPAVNGEFKRWQNDKRRSEEMVSQLQHSVKMRLWLAHKASTFCGKMTCWLPPDNFNRQPHLILSAALIVASALLDCVKSFVILFNSELLGDVFSFRSSLMLHNLKFRLLNLSRMREDNRPIAVLHYHCIWKVGDFSFSIFETGGWEKFQREDFIE
jgi:hypothetical protein